MIPKKSYLLRLRRDLRVCVRWHNGYHLAELMSSDSMINDINRVLADKQRHQMRKMQRPLCFQNRVGKISRSVSKNK